MSPILTTKGKFMIAGRTTRSRSFAIFLVMLVAAVTLVMAASSSGAAGNTEARGDGRAYPDRTCEQLGFAGPTNYKLDNAGGYVQVFFSSAKDANCLQTINSTSIARRTHIYLARSGTGMDYALDFGTYRSYAGAVVLLNAGGHCIDFSGYVDYRGGSEVNVRKAHCG
ncbi:hypothetical protein [Georgenia deserti]|uniref:Spore-associated protein A n=1 Tax=Georgenia deserti TaxID=2093781 RepID=A0ABW4L2K7_9MICO